MQESQDKPQTPEDALAEIVRKHQLARGLIPHGMPLKPVDAAHWWIERQDPASNHEKPHRLKDAWKTPYSDRLCNNLQKFLTEEPDSQRVILAAWEDGIFWRGEDNRNRYDGLEGRTTFENVIHEIERCRAMGHKAYLAEIRAREKKATANLTQGEK